MALYVATTPDIPQTAQSVNVGQFGPSHDSLQDWRSIFTMANEIKRIEEELNQVSELIKVVAQDALDAVKAAQAAVSVAEQINEDTISNVEVRWQQIQEVHQEVEDSEADAEIAAAAAKADAIETAEDVVEVAEYVKDSIVLKNEMVDIREDVTKLTVNLSIVAEAEDARAEFDASKNHLKLFVPNVVAGSLGTITSVNGQSGPAVVLSASDLGAIPDDGSVAIKDKLNFTCDATAGTNCFEIDAIKVGDVEQFSLSYQGDGAVGNKKRGLVLDKVGNGAFGGELYVNNTTDASTRKKVYHEGYKPTAAQIGAVVASDVYTKSETYSKAQTYSSSQIDSKVNGKLTSNPNDGRIYGRQNSSWYDVGSRLSSLQSSINGKEPTLASERKRYIYTSTGSPSSGSGSNGDIWIKYK